jgi:hypothetical protein
MEWKELTPDILYLEQEIKRGTIVKRRDGQILLIGDVTPLMGMCDCCKDYTSEYYSNELVEKIETMINLLVNS